MKINLNYKVIFLFVLVFLFNNFFRYKKAKIKRLDK